MNVPLRYHLAGGTAKEIAASVEAGLRTGWLAPGDALPPVRTLAGDLGVAPATVASAYRQLRLRGLATGAGRRGTRLSGRPPVSPGRPDPPVPAGARDLAAGSPDAALLPPLGAALAALDPSPVLYGASPHHGPLLDLAAGQFRTDSVAAGRISVIGGALDGVERILQAHLRPGDRVAVEDPGYSSVLDLVVALGLVAVPVPVDDCGLRPDGLSAALRAGAVAAIVTPRAQNPTGAAFDARRQSDLGDVLRAHPAALVIEDDHAGPVAGSPYLTLSGATERWAVVRSVSKWLGPDLRVATLAGDEVTVARVEGRQRLGAGWVSHLLQQVVAARWAAPDTPALLAAATGIYGERRQALLDELAARGIPATGRSGLNVWIPVREEQPVVAALLAAGYAVMAGERYRSTSGPAVRITTARLTPDEAPAVAAAVAGALRPDLATRQA